MGPQATGAYRRAIAARYRHADRRTKGQILNELCEVTGYHRKAAIRLLRDRPADHERTRKRRGRAVIYGARTIAALVAI